MELERSSKETQELEFRGSDSGFTLDHSPSLTMYSEATSVLAKDPSLAPGPPTIQVCSDEMATGFLEIPSRNPRLRSPSVCELPRPRSPSISEALTHRQERRLSYQLQSSGAFEDEDQLEGGRLVQYQRGPQLSPGFFRPTRSRVEEPYVFSMSQSPFGGRMIWDRRGSAPAERLQQTSEPMESVSKFQKSSALEKLQLPVRANLPAAKEMTQRTASPLEKKFQVALQATSSLDRGAQAPSHSRWATRALSLPVSECLIAVSSGQPEASGNAAEFAAASPEGAVASGSRFLSEQTRSLLLCPPELPCRRRSVSTEWCAHLESIAEESASMQKTNRRYSIPSLPATDM